MILVGLAPGWAFGADEAEGPLAGAALHGTQDARLRFWRVPEELPGFEDLSVYDYIELVERLDVAGGSDRLSVSARVDGVALFSNRYYLDDVLYHERDLLGEGVASPFDDALVGVEKLRVESRGRALRVAAGDGYASFGRGLALNLVKNTEIDIDTSVRGAHLSAESRDWGVSVIAGLTNPQQVALENPNVGLEPDLMHAVTGLRLDRWGLGPVNVGVHGAMVQYAPVALDPRGPFAAFGEAPGAMVAGATVEALGVGGVDLFVEGDGYAYTSPSIPVPSGMALYGSASAYPGRTTLLLEARSARNTEYINTFSSGYEIASGPTLEYERVVTEDSAAAVNSNDIDGARLRADLRLGDAAAGTTLLPYLSMAAFRDRDVGGLHFNQAPETILHPIAGVQYIRGETHLIANAGHRWDVRDPGEAGEDLGTDTLLHADADLAVHLAGPLTLELTPSVMLFGWGKNLQQQEDFVDVSNALALKLGSPWAFIVYTDWSTNPLLPTDGNLSEDAYGALELQWRPGPSTTLKAFWGAYRGGIRCAGGQCRTLPGFDGAKFSFSTTF